MCRKAEASMFPPSHSADADVRLPAARGLRGDAGAGDFAGGDRGAGEYPVPVLAAAVLAAEHVSFLLVGSAALWLHGEQIAVGDADVGVVPGGPNSPRLR